jgi:hypothetical protein
MFSLSFFRILDLPSADVNVVKGKLVEKDFAFVMLRDIAGQAGQQAAYYTATTVTNVTFIIELKFKAGMNICKVTVRSPNKALSEGCKTAVGRIISA